MQTSPPSEKQMAIFGRLQLSFIGILTLAFIAWEVQDFAASFAASEMVTQTTLRTTTERDDARVMRAFEEARRSLRVNATLETDPNLKQETRESKLTIVGKSKPQVLADRASMVSAMQSTFKTTSGDELYDVGNAPHAEPVQDHAYLMVKQGFRWGALALLLFGLMNLIRAWKFSHLPKGALFGILATAFTLILTGLGREANSIWFLLVVVGPPVALIVLIWVVSYRVHRARFWTEDRAKVISSKVVVEHHRFAADTTKVRNLPHVEYEFDAGTGPIRGDRISLGFGTADNVDVVLKRYPVGGTVPVFYDPRNPQDCVLERKPPVSFGCMWGGAITVVLIYLAVVLGMSSVVSINKLFETAVPQIHHPVLVGIMGLLGLLALATGIWNLLHPRKVLAWIKVKGTIVSSETESFREVDSSHRHTTLYRPVIEFSYQAEGQEYHNILGSSGVTMSASSKQWADGEVARYPVGTQVDVFYNPENPTQSSLTANAGMTLSGRSSLVVAAILIATALYAAGH
jgi:hypothetical protein